MARRDYKEFRFVWIHWEIYLQKDQMKREGAF